MKYTAPKGVKDILPADSFKWRFVENTFRTLCAQWGYQEIRTPIFENVELFTRGLGDTTDIVTKEMYELTTKGGDKLALKPEGTAPVVRAYIENHLGAPGATVKLYYLTPIFRYERPQAGRFRQAHQVGLEIIGCADPMADAEVIALTVQFYRKLGVKDAALKLNSVGTPNCRPAYRQALLDYAKPYFADMDSEYVARLERNPMRLLDSKDPDIKKIMNDAPDIADYLDDESREHFDKLIAYLDLMDIVYERDKFLVRGLDYYTKTAFEVVSGSLGAQNALCGGGRYDGLIEECGGNPTPGVGVAMGIERALIAMETAGTNVPADNGVDVFIAVVGNTRKEAFKLLMDFRSAGVAAEMELGEKSLKAQMRLADKLSARYVVIIGEDELSRGAATVRNMATNEQKEKRLDGLINSYNL